MDVGSGVDGIAKDVHILADESAFGWTLLVLSFGLPVAALFSLTRRRWVALLPLAMTSGVLTLWFLYYATSWFANPGQAAWMPTAFFVVVGWAIFVADAMHVRRGT
jgi:hypothetical protein